MSYKPITKLTLITLKITSQKYWVEQGQSVNKNIVLRELIDMKYKPVPKLVNTYRMRVLKQFGLGENVASYIEDILMVHFFANRSHILELRKKIDYCYRKYQKFEKEYFCGAFPTLRVLRLNVIFAKTLKNVTILGLGLITYQQLIKH